MFRGQLYVGVVHFGFSVQVGILLGHDEDHRVLGYILHWGVERTLLLVGLDGVFGSGDGIVPLNGLPPVVIDALQRVEFEERERVGAGCGRVGRGGERVGQLLAEPCHRVGQLCGLQLVGRLCGLQAFGRCFRLTVWSLCCWGGSCQGVGLLLFY